MLIQPFSELGAANEGQRVVAGRGSRAATIFDRTDQQAGRRSWRAIRCRSFGGISADDSQGEDRADRCLCPISGNNALGAGHQAKPSCLPPPSARRDQHAVKLESLILAEESDLESLTWEWLPC